MNHKIPMMSATLLLLPLLLLHQWHPCKGFCCCNP
jgi:hypothetical protein